MPSSSVLLSNQAVGIRGGTDVGPRRPAVAQEEVAQFLATRSTASKVDLEAEAYERWLRAIAHELAGARDFRSSHPDSTTASARLAQIAWVAGEVDEAKEAAHHIFALARSSYDQAAVFIAANVLMASHEGDRLLEYLSEVAPQRALEVFRAALYVDRGDLDRALAILQDLDAAGAATLRGYIRLAQNQPAAAIAELRGAIRRVPDDADALVNLAYAYRQLGSLKKSLRYARQANQVAPGRQDVAHFLLDELIEAGQLEGAKLEIRQIQSRRVQESADFLVLQARVAHGLGNRSRAIGLLRRAEAASTSDRHKTELRANIASLQASFGELDRNDALSTLRACLAAEPQSLAIAMMLSDSLHLCSEADELRSVLQLLRLGGHSEQELLPIRTHLEYLAGDFEATRDLALEWAKADPTSAPAAALACMLTGQLSDDWPSAANLAALALRRIPGSSWLRNDAAYVLALAGRAYEALGVIEGADLNQFVPAATKGLVLVAAGKVQEGLRQYRRAAEMADIQADDATGRTLMTVHQAAALRRLGISAKDLQDVRAAALPPVGLPTGWEDYPGFLLLRQVAQSHGWPWPLMVE